jgi:NDP-sugar pyrophosphorylase family protein
MKAMILAAGLGTRLRPLTNDRPKALVTVAGRTMLEITLARLRVFGVNEVIVNTHHYAEMIHDHLDAKKNFGMRIEISHEEELLDTGGGLKKAAWFFLEGKKPNDPSLAPFILHNVDVISTIDIAKMARAHEESGALATLAVMDRETSRYLLFDEKGLLCGRRRGNDLPEMVSSHPGDKNKDVARVGQPNSDAAQSAQALAFCGIHVLSPRIFDCMTESGPFSIVDAYLRMAAHGEKILAFRADGAYWRDLGKPESVEAAAREAAAWSGQPRSNS